MPKYKQRKKDVPTITQKGLVICYIGTGKGKTSAAMGLAVRAAGAGFNVFILQFVKARKPSNDEELQPGEWPLSYEIEYFNQVSSPRGIGKIDNEQIGRGFVGILGDRKERDEHIKEAINGLARARGIMLSGDYHLVILDELLTALELKLIEERDVLDLISQKPPDLHLVLTGHDKFPKIIKACDLVTEMKMIKHPYYEGVLAQMGIDF